MQLDIIKLAEQLQNEASILLKNDALWQPFTANGKIHVAGSTYLDLLVFPDLDIYFEEDDDSNLLEIFAKAAKNLISINQVTSIEFEKEMHKRYPNQVPEGICLQYRIYNQLRYVINIINIYKISLYNKKNI